MLDQQLEAGVHLRLRLQLGDEFSASATELLRANKLDQANLLEVLQALTRRRDELRLIDKQLFDLMAECFVRLKPRARSAGSEQALSDGTQSSTGSASGSSCSSAPGCAVDLSRLSPAAGVAATTAPVSSTMPGPLDERGECSKQNLGNKRGQHSSGNSMAHIKKQRLLSAIISTDDIGEKQQVLAEKELDVRNGDERPVKLNDLRNGSINLNVCNSPYQQQEQAQLSNNQHHRQAKPGQQFGSSCSESASPSSTFSSRSCASTSSLAAPVKGQRPAFSAVAFKQQLQFDSGNNSSASDLDDDGLELAGRAPTERRPQLKKFYSIGTAEMSFERFSRQQHLIDSTLATLANNTAAGAQQMLVPASDGPSAPCHLSPADAKQASRPFVMMAPQYQALESDRLAREVPAGLSYEQLLGQRQQHHHSLALQQLAAAFPGPSAGYVPLPVHMPMPLPMHLQMPVAVQMPLPLTSPPQDRQRLGGSGTVPASTFNRLLAGPKGLSPILRKMPFRCHVCSNCFEDRHRLQQHLSIHLNLDPGWFEEKTIKETMAQYELRRGDYLCRVCQLRYETTSEFDKHMHLHGEKPHQCELCMQDNKFVSFRYFRQLLTHLRSHCFLYSCKFAPECRQTANRKDYLKLHILKHHLNNKLPEQFTICCHGVGAEAGASGHLMAR